MPQCIHARQKNGKSASKKPKNIILVESNASLRGRDLWIVLGGGGGGGGGCKMDFKVEPESCEIVGRC